MPATVRTDVLIPSADPDAIVHQWKDAVQRSLGGFLRKPTFIDWYDAAIEQYGIPEDADACCSFAGPPGVVNVLGSCFARRQSGGTLFVYWTTGPMLVGAAKRDAVHDAVSARLQERFPNSREV